MLNGTMRLVEDWQAVREKIARFDWARRIVDKFKPDTDWWVAHYADDPARVAGWGHHYFCDRCFAALIFDPGKPGVHRCGGCGELREAQVADDAWAYIYRTGSCSQVFNAAVLYNLYGDEKYMAYIRKVLGFLCEHYGRFEVRTPPNQEGRFTGCDLTDGVAVIWLLNGMELVKERFTAEELETYKRRFFIPEAEFLIGKVGVTPNIICWMKAAAGMTGLFFGEPVWCERAAEGEYGIKKKLGDGLLPQGFWYEASMHYHFYCAEGLTYYLAFCKIYGHSFPMMEDGLLRMYRYPVNYAFANGEFPNPNDGWPQLKFGNYAQQYEWVRNVRDEPAFRYALSKCYERPGESLPGASIGGIARLLFGRDWENERFDGAPAGSGLPDGKSRHDPDIYFALLRSGQAEVFLKYGYVLRGHSHADLMNFELFVEDEVLSRDISNSGYGSDLFREWQRKTIAHNSVMLDRETQPNRPRGRLLAFDAVGATCSVAADEVYPGYGFARSLRLHPDRLEDRFYVTPAEGADGSAHTIDWFFHCTGELSSALPFAPCERPGDGDGYQLMLETARCDTDGDWEVHWALKEKKVTLRMAGCPGTSVYIFKGYEHRLDLVRWGVMVRRVAASAAFEAEYEWETT
ncbi:heparinase II/III family protein [Paenibacillus sp. MWE-103]|uniref:Heparinase II/III family protein n=1 Tax=Paenibacillus artemisiicola TaxID=1172618 RepID=A0ABS3WDS3_9BACL|nr:heparinase II/III family protein [Paenibacillus artemisiicola]MBO7746413.1 heparinase II/III family protein [Paenibacillus artemisiicola]